MLIKKINLWNLVVF